MEIFKTVKKVMLYSLILPFTLGTFYLFAYMNKDTYFGYIDSINDGRVTITSKFSKEKIQLSVNSNFFPGCPSDSKIEEIINNEDRLVEFHTRGYQVQEIGLRERIIYARPIPDFDIEK